MTVCLDILRSTIFWEFQLLRYVKFLLNIAETGDWFWKCGKEQLGQAFKQSDSSSSLVLGKKVWTNT